MSAFVASQVIIDVESLYWIAQHAWPVHRVLHTFVGGAIVGLSVALAVKGVARIAFVPALVGGMVGGLSHSLLDGIMHSDIQPLRPISAGNPFLGWVDVVTLHLACVAAGLLGVVVLGVRRMSRKNA